MSIYKTKEWIGSFVNRREESYWDALSKNTHPRAIEILENNLTKINFNLLASNPAAVHLYKKCCEAGIVQMDIAEWYYLSGNTSPEAIEMLENNPDDINWMALSSNMSAVHLLEQNPEEIYWNFLSSNSAAIHLLKKNQRLINWDRFSENTHPEAIEMLAKNPDKINWDKLSANPAAMHLLEKYPHKIVWCMLSKNENAIHLLEKNQTAIDWDNIIYNKNALNIIKSNTDKIHPVFWNDIMSNPAIYDYDYVAMKKTANVFKEELMAAAWHPSRVMKWIENGVDEWFDEE